MTSLYLTREELEDSNPLDLIESIIADNDWSFDRQGNNELTVGVVFGPYISPAPMTSRYLNGNMDLFMNCWRV